MIRLEDNIKNANAVTHSGKFHADDVFSTVIVDKYLGDVNLVRVPEFKGDGSEDIIVYDIGGGKFDHHQVGGNGSRGRNNVPYAACGLLWREFGPEILKPYYQPERVWEAIEESLIQPIDAHDNGRFAKGGVLSPSIIVAQMNQHWNADEDSNECFLRATKFAELTFDAVFKDALSKIEAEPIVLNAIDNASERIMILDKNVPWKDCVLKRYIGLARGINAVVFPDRRSNYCFQFFANSASDFSKAPSAPVAWRGLENEDLQQITGVETAKFCHQQGFIGGAETLDDAVKLAKMCIEYSYMDEGFSKKRRK